MKEPCGKVEDPLKYIHAIEPADWGNLTVNRCDGCGSVPKGTFLVLQLVCFASAGSNLASIITDMDQEEQTAQIAEQSSPELLQKLM